MDKTIAGMIGAVAALSAAVPAEAATDGPMSADVVMRVGSYADLLRPIPNASAVLAAVDAADAARVRTVQYYYADGPYDHHHHHHHRVYRRRYYHHHHHHHHHHASAARVIGRVLGDIAR